MCKNKRIIIASPNRRNDLLVDNLKNMLLDFELVRFCSKEELTLDNIKELNPKYIAVL